MGTNAYKFNFKKVKYYYFKRMLMLKLNNPYDPPPSTNVCILGLQRRIWRFCLFLYSSQTRKTIWNALQLLVQIIATLHALTPGPGKWINLLTVQTIFIPYIFPLIFFSFVIPQRSRKRVPWRNFLNLFVVK